MATFESILKNTILKIQRLDSEADYDFFSPNAIIFTFENQTEKLVISAKNDGSSIDTKITSDKQIEEDYGLEFGAHISNELKKGDGLGSFIGDTIETIRIAEYTLPEITGFDFIIIQGKFAGVELKTKWHKLLFHNNNGGWCDIDDDVAELSNQERWQWK